MTDDKFKLIDNESNACCNCAHMNYDVGPWQMDMECGLHTSFGYSLEGGNANDTFDYGQNFGRMVCQDWE